MSELTRDLDRYAVISAIILLTIACYLVMRPFITAFLWGAIIAISTHGLYKRVLRVTGERRRLAATLTTLGMVIVLLVPVAILGLSLAHQLPAFADRVTAVLSGDVKPPPDWVREIPLVGKWAAKYWQSVTSNPERLRTDLLPLLKPVREFLIAFSTGVASGVLEFAVALLIAGVLYTRGEEFGGMIDRVAEHFGGEVGRQQVAVADSTVRGVFKGVLGTSAVQGILAAFGFWLAGVPRPVMLGIATFFLSLIPGGPLILALAAAAWLSATGSTGWAAFMVVWGLIVSSSDNVIRPFLIGKGVETPLVLILLGVIGGMVAFGFLGIFIGPTLLAVAHNLTRQWMGRELA